MATQVVYVIKVRNAPPPRCHLLPSERQYSAQSVLGLACVHLALAGLACVLASLRNHALQRCFWPFVLVPLLALASGISGLFAWRRWYEGVHIRIFLGVTSLTLLTCVSVAAADALLAASLHVPVELNAVLTSVSESLWSAVSVFVAWRGVWKKGDDEVTSSTTPLAPDWRHDDLAKSQARVLEYLREHSRPPVEGKEKDIGDVIPEPS